MWKEYKVYKRSSLKKLLLKRFIFIQGIVSLVLALCVGLYINILTNKVYLIESHKLVDAFWEIRYWNLLLIFCIFLIVSQGILLSIPQKSFIEISSILVQKVLEAASASLRCNNRNINIRAIVTLIDKSGRTRTTRYSYNVRPDPERTATFPLDFGVTGEAILNRKVVFKELPPNHMETYPKNIRTFILPELKWVLAAPIYLPEKENAGPIGVLAFDSADDFNKTSYNSREAKDIAQAWADIIGGILVVIY